MFLWTVAGQRFSDAFGGGYAAAADGGGEGLVVLVVLVGVPGGEVGDRPVETVVTAEVFGHGDRVARAGVAAGQGPPAQVGVEQQGGRGHPLDDRGGLHVPQLPPVVVPVVLHAFRPAQVNVAGGLHH